MSFDLQEVFSSVQSFLGSGYVLLVVIGVLGIGILKKLISICVTAAIIFLIWFFCQDAIASAWSGIMGSIF